jgi:hypothetical protein
MESAPQGYEVRRLHLSLPTMPLSVPQKYRNYFERLSVITIEIIVTL